MRTTDLLRFATRSLAGARTRTLLMLLAMSIGVASVVVLTALGEGARRYVVGEFAQLGTHLLIMLPGRSETTGGAPPLFGETPRDLTLDDALALLRDRSIMRVAPLTVGNAPVSRGSREREVTVIGATHEFFPIRHLKIGSGRPLPVIDPERGANVVVLGAGLRQELFGKQPRPGSVGAHRRPALPRNRHTRRRRRIPWTEPRRHGDHSGGLGTEPVRYPFAVSCPDPGSQRARHPPGAEGRANIIRERHDGEDDVTIITQDALLSTFDGILRALTYTVGGIAGISLAVAGILIMNVMLVAVSQRVAEIGLLKALGAPERQILRIFLVESHAAGGRRCRTRRADRRAGAGPAVSGFSLRAAVVIAAAIGIALSTGLVFGVLPARRAARQDPVLALSGR